MAQKKKVDEGEDEKEDENIINSYPQVIRYDPEQVQRLHDKVISIMQAFTTNEDLVKFQALADEFVALVSRLYLYLLKEINEGHPRFSVTASTITYDFQRLLQTIANALYIIASKLINYYKQKIQESITKNDVNETIANILRSIDVAYAIAIVMERSINALIGKMNINLPSGLTSREYAHGVLGIDFNI